MGFDLGRFGDRCKLPAYREDGSPIGIDVSIPEYSGVASTLIRKVIDLLGECQASEYGDDRIFLAFVRMYMGLRLCKNGIEFNVRENFREDESFGGKAHYAKNEQAGKTLDYETEPLVLLFLTNEEVIESKLNHI